MRLLIGLQYALGIIPAAVAAAIGLAADDPPVVAVALVGGALSVVYVTMRIRREGP